MTRKLQELLIARNSPSNIEICKKYGITMIALVSGLNFLRAMDYEVPVHRHTNRRHNRRVNSMPSLAEKRVKNRSTK